MKIASIATISLICITLLWSCQKEGNPAPEENGNDSIYIRKMDMIDNATNDTFARYLFEYDASKRVTKMTQLF